MKVYLDFRSAQHDPLNDDWAVLELRLRPDGPTRHGMTRFYSVPGRATPRRHESSWAQVGPAWHSPLTGYTGPIPFHFWIWILTGNKKGTCFGSFARSFFSALLALDDAPCRRNHGVLTSSRFTVTSTLFPEICITSFY
jgi:hypothetical protein